MTQVDEYGGSLNMRRSCILEDLQDFLCLIDPIELSKHYSYTHGCKYVALITIKNLLVLLSSSLKVLTLFGFIVSDSG